MLTVVLYFEDIGKKDLLLCRIPNLVALVRKMHELSILQQVGKHYCRFIPLMYSSLIFYGGSAYCQKHCGKLRKEQIAEKINMYHEDR